MRSRVRRTFCICVAALALGALVGTRPLFAQSAARHYYLDDLIYTHDYVPGKNSFVLQDLRRGERKTLLDLPGSGSVRHLWSTWAEATGENGRTENRKILLRVFVDGEARPSIAGPIDELCLAAENSGARYAPQPAFNFKRSFNLYLPIYFARGIHIEIEALGEFRQFYAQLDYRLTRRAERHARLVSATTPQGLVLKYAGRAAPAVQNGERSSGDAAAKIWQTTLSANGGSDSYELTGPAIVRQLAFEGDGLDDVEVAITWDDDTTPAVATPLRYLFGGFETLALQSKPKLRICYFPMPFLKRARIQLRNSAQFERVITVRIGVDRNTAPPAAPYYFHARFQEINPSLGYRDFVLLATRGEGHFVGVTLFDTGHDHGGGDTALLDADTVSPHVLHGICGEDYFSFAWFGTDRMHLLAGAPEQNRRYRLHLENPYPFRSSMIFTFGVFAGLHPKGVAFWYQRRTPALSPVWLAPDVPWKVFGPVGIGQEMPDDISDQVIETAVPIVRAERFSVGWSDAEMVQGFLDLSHHYRHYIMQRQGTGFIAGECRLRAVTFVHSPRELEIEAVVGHDDAIELSLNGAPASRLPARSGLQPSRIKLHFRPGWNKLAFVLDNDENVDWRWLGFSLAFRADKSVLADLRFSVNKGEGLK